MTQANEARNDNRTVVTSVSLDRGTVDLLVQLARQEQRSRSQIMRRALRVYAGVKEEEETE